MLASHPALQEIYKDAWQGGIKTPPTYWHESLQSFLIYFGAFTIFTIPFMKYFKDSYS